MSSGTRTTYSRRINKCFSSEFRIRQPHRYTPEESSDSAKAGYCDNNNKYEANNLNISSVNHIVQRRDRIKNSIQNSVMYTVQETLLKMAGIYNGQNALFMTTKSIKAYSIRNIDTQ